MATKSFLKSDELEQALTLLKPPASLPDGNEVMVSIFKLDEFNDWLSSRLLERLAKFDRWHEAGPIALGSWARGEIAPRSDIDMLFVGDEEAVREVVDSAASEGLKLRYRVPADQSDWTIGVEPFDVIALLDAKPLTEPARALLANQLAKLKSAKKRSVYTRKLSRAMKSERESRAERYDSIANYLEPNLKYGPGALRDIHQATVIRKLYQERFDVDSEHAVQVMTYYRKFFHMTRLRLHLTGQSGDLLAANDQAALAEWFGFRDVRDFMREIQKGLARVSFYADWTVAQAHVEPMKRVRDVQNYRLDSVGDLFRGLEKDSGILMQNRVRLAADTIFSRARATRRGVLQLKGVDDLDSVIGFELTRFLSRALLSADKSKSAGRAKDSNEAESALVALFRSRLIDHCIPEFRGIIGLVQHDQYHRLSVDAHILQAARELVRIRKNPKLLGRLSSLTKDWKPRDWQVLIWSCIYHDLAKGRHGDHSIEGAKLAEADLRRLGVDEAQIADVQWIVLRHLSLSRAAFRQNPHSPDVWRELAAQGAVGDRLRLLVVFTVIDIRATNIEAWTPWKDRLLFELIQQLEKPSTAAIVALTTRFSDRLATSFIEQLDPFLVQSLPLKVLIQDLEQLIEIAPSSSLAPLLVRVRNGKQTWIRFHSSVDRPGLLFEFAQSLAQAGLSLRHAAIHTDARVGVYDWFEVKSPKSPAAIRKLIQLSLKRTAPTDEKRASIKSGVSDQSTKVQPRKLLFESVELVSSHQDEWVLSFRGRDHAGALVSAVEALFDVGLEIRWARVHTWGRQIDDVFGVRPHGKVEAEQALLQIRSKF